jgi:ribosomal protein S18 acetylase RimI-like enzyme
MNLFATTRSDELAALARYPAQAETFITMQYKAQLQIHQAIHPDAENKIIFLDDRPIGRILVERGPAEFHLVDISILPEHRKAGIGGGLLRELLLEAASVAKSVKLFVISYNPARRLYERLGFSPIADDGTYIEMKWSNPA